MEPHEHCPCCQDREQLKHWQRQLNWQAQFVEDPAPPDDNGG